jgi:hypothetical protein
LKIHKNQREAMKIIEHQPTTQCESIKISENQ